VPGGALQKKEPLKGMKMNEVENKSQRTVTILRVFFGLVFLFGIQLMAGKLGWAIADFFSCETVDPDGVFVPLSIHHLILMEIALAIILIMRIGIQADFGFQWGDRKMGFRYFLLFTATIAVIAMGYHALLRALGQPISYDYPLTTRNILGTLGFQLFLTGTSEEILYRALPVTLIIFAFGKSVSISKHVTWEVVLASFLFTAAHIHWTISPFSISELNIFGLVYAFAMGILNGVVYQKTRSILYPMLMHSVSNVIMVGSGYLFALLI